MLSFATVALAGATVGFTTGVDLMSVKSLDLGTSVGASALAAGAAAWAAAGVSAEEVSSEPPQPTTTPITSIKAINNKGILIALNLDTSFMSHSFTR